MILWLILNATWHSGDSWLLECLFTLKVCSHYRASWACFSTGLIGHIWPLKTIISSISLFFLFSFLGILSLPLLWLWLSGSVSSTSKNCHPKLLLFRTHLFPSFQMFFLDLQGRLAEVLMFHLCTTSSWFYASVWSIVLELSRLGGMRGMRLSTKREQERKQDHKIINDK